jgi:hypothetical protein
MDEDSNTGGCIELALEDGVHHPQRPTLNHDRLTGSEPRARRDQSSVCEPLPQAVDDGIADDGRTSVLLEHPPHAGGPTDDVPLGESFGNPDEGVPRKDPAAPPVPNAPGSCSRRWRELWGVALYTLHGKELANLRLAIRCGVKHVPHGNLLPLLLPGCRLPITTLQALNNATVRSAIGNSYKSFTEWAMPKALRNNYRRGRK